MLVGMLIVACDGGDSATSSAGNPFLSGTTGLRIDFSPGAPPDEVFDQDEFSFDVEIELENVGERDIDGTDVIVKIDGISADEFGVSSGDLVIDGIADDLEGAKKDPISGQRDDGDIVFVTFEDFSYQPEIVGASRERPLIGTVCYEYGTTAVAEICILEDVVDDDSDVCVVDAQKTPYSSGAPIQVTSFVERSAGANKVEFQFVIQDQGSSSEIYEKESGCEDEREFEDVVFVEVDTGLDGLRCAGLREGTDTEGSVTLRDGKFTVRCTQEVDTVTDFERTVTINLEYAVEDSAKTDLIIRHSE